MRRGSVRARGVRAAWGTRDGQREGAAQERKAAHKNGLGPEGEIRAYRKEGDYDKHTVLGCMFCLWLHYGRL